MPIIKSAKKRVKTAHKATVRNSKTKRTLREALKAFNSALDGGDKTEIEKTQREAVSALDMAAKKAVIHKNKAARKKAQISAKAKASGAKQTTKPKTVIEKAPAESAKIKKSPAKKTTPKK